MKIVESNNEKTLYMRINQLRGVLALIVLLSHVWGYTGYVFLVPFNKVVTIAVAFFFFLSGYGLYRSYQTKAHYTKEIIYVKIPYLIYMAVSIYLFSALFEWLVNAGGHNTYLPFGIGTFLKSTNWYVYELIGFYILFIVAMRYVREKYQIMFIGITSVIGFLLLFSAGVVEAYYNSIIGFCFGIYFAKQNGFLHVVKHKGSICIRGVAILAASGLAMIILRHDTMLFAIIRNIAAVGAITIAVCAILYVDTEDKFLRYLSKVSPEIYFYHMPIAVIGSRIFTNQLLYFTYVVFMTTVFTVMLNPINNYIHGIIRKKYVNGMEV